MGSRKLRDVQGALWVRGFGEVSRKGAKIAEGRAIVEELREGDAYLTPDMLLIWDRNFFSYELWKTLNFRGIAILARVNSWPT